MHPVYSTEGIILSSKIFGEASRIFFVYTKDFGLIKLSGQGVRKLSSKLRFHLADFNLVKLDLVRGKEFWRPVKVEKICRFSQNLKTVANIFNLILRLTDLEEKNQALFFDLKNALFLPKSDFNSKALEAVLVLRILANLGYLGDKSLLSFVTSPLSEDIFQRAAASLPRIIPIINEALKQSQL